MVFVDRAENRYLCQVPVEDGLCGKLNLKKDRLLAHIRKEHLQFRPLACSGQCGLPVWLVAPLQHDTQTLNDLTVAAT
jgi:hypothetical protein